MAKLINLTAGDTEVPLEAATLTIGRDSGSGLALLDHTLVSDRHASLREENNRWYLRDEGSRFGTYVNDRRVKDQGLQHGDVIELGLGGPTFRFEAGSEERERNAATTAGRLKQYYEQAVSAPPPPEPLEGAGKIAVPVAARGVLFAIGGIALVAVGALWVGGRGETAPAVAEGTPSPTAPGGALYPLGRASRTYYEGLERLSAEAERERDGAPRRVQLQSELESVVASLEAGSGGPAAADSLAARRDELEAELDRADRLAASTRAAAAGLVLIQTGFEVDGQYFPGPTGTGFYAGDGAIVTSRHVVEPDTYIRSADEVELACALKELANQGKSPVKVISVWGTGNSAGRGADGAFDPATATLSTTDGTVEEAGSATGNAGESRAFGCPAGGIVESQHVEGSDGDLALLRVSGSDGEPLSLGDGVPSGGAMVALTGYPRGSLAAAGGGPLTPWMSWARVSEAADHIVFDVPVLAGTDGAPVLDAEGRVVGVGLATRDGRGVALPVRHVRALLGGR